MTMQAILLGASASAGSQTFTSAGSFLVPSYSSLTVVAEGANNTSIVSGVCDGGTYYGGAGGKATKTWALGAAGAPSPGSSISITVASGVATFASTTNVKGNPGGAPVGGNLIPATEANPESCISGSNGSLGTATGGDTNVTGGSSKTTATISISWV